jgi:ribosomal protein L11
MKNLSRRQIKQVKKLQHWTSTSFHKNRKNVGSLTVDMIKEIVNKKKERLKNKVL